MRLLRRAGRIIDKERGDIERDGISRPRPHQMQHQIQRRGGTTSGETLTIDNETIRPDINGTMRGSKGFQILPMGRRPFAIQHPCPRHQPGPGLHPANCQPAPCDPPKPGKKPGRAMPVYAEGGEDDHPFRIRFRVKTAGNRNRQAAGAFHWCAIRRENPPVKQRPAGHTIRAAHRLHDRGQ